jgi:hypothetical protein
MDLIMVLTLVRSFGFQNAPMGGEQNRRQAEGLHKWEPRKKETVPVTLLPQGTKRGAVIERKLAMVGG